MLRRGLSNAQLELELGAAPPPCSEATRTAAARTATTRADTADAAASRTASARAAAARVAAAAALRLAVTAARCVPPGSVEFGRQVLTPARAARGVVRGPRGGGEAARRRGGAHHHEFVNEQLGGLCARQEDDLCTKHT